MRRGDLDLSNKGVKASETRAAPMTFVAKVVSSCSRRVGALEDIPALLMKTSTWPCFSSTTLAAAAMDASDVTSRTSGERVDLVMVSERMDSTAAVTFSGLRPATKMW